MNKRANLYFAALLGAMSPLCTVSALAAQSNSTIATATQQQNSWRALKKVPNFKLHSLFLNFNSCPRSISSFKSGILFWTGI